MNRTHRKFIWMSGAVHVLLLALLILGPAFMPKRPSPIEDLPVLQLVPSEVAMEAIYGGGSPKPPEPTQEPTPTPEPPKPRPPEPQRTPTPQRREESPKPRPPEPQRTPTPQRREEPPKPRPPEPQRTPTPQPRTEPPKRAPEPKPKIRVNDTIVTRTTDTEAARRKEQERTRQQAAADRQALKQRFAQAQSSIEKRASGETKIFTGGAGGPAVASYLQVVQDRYYRSWTPPASPGGNTKPVLVEIVVNHDGRILSNKILKPSGIGPLDASVQVALDRVRAQGLPSFPAEMKAQGELQKTIKINFDLLSKLSSG